MAEPAAKPAPGASVNQSSQLHCHVVQPSQSALEADAHRVAFKTSAPSHYLPYTPQGPFLTHKSTMHTVPPAMPSQHVPKASQSKACHCSKQLSQHYPACECMPCLPPGSHQPLIWLLQNGRQSRTILLWPILNRPALLVMSPRYAHHMQQAALQLSGD